MNKLNHCRISIFYDGYYFQSVSNFYANIHERHSGIDIRGLHDFIIQQASLKEDIPQNKCHIIGAHFYKGRFAARDNNNNARTLFLDRQLDDTLSINGVSPHYFLLQTSTSGLKRERGVSVALSLEAYEHALENRCDLIVLIAGSGDYLPLVRKLNSRGVRVLLLGWNVRYTNATGREREIRSSYALMNEATYSVPVSDLIDDASADDPIINGLFRTPNDITDPHGAGSTISFWHNYDEAEPDGNEDKTDDGPKIVGIEGSDIGLRVVGKIDLPEYNHRAHLKTTPIEEMYDNETESDELPDGVYRGFIQHISQDYTYAFIQSIGFEKNVFCHYRYMDADMSRLPLGTEVIFEIGENPKTGEEMAIHVEVIN